MVLQGRSLVVLYGAPPAYLLVVHVIGALLSYFHVVSYLYFMSAIWYCKAVLWCTSCLSYDRCTTTTFGALLSYFHVLSYKFVLYARPFYGCLLSFGTVGAPYYGRVSMLIVDCTNISIKDF